MKLKLNLYKFSVYIRKRLAHNQDDLDRTLILESGLFDADFYRAAYPDIADIEDPLLHFIISGADEGRRPNARFDTKFYSDTVSNKREWRINPLVHYLLVGRQQGAATVDPREIGPTSEEALVRDSGLFDEAFYREEHPETAQVGDVLAHYVHFGAKKGWWPSADFDPTYYSRIYKDVAESGLPPFIHYLTTGRAEQRLTKEAGPGGERIVETGQREYRPGTPTVYFEEARPVAGEPRVDALAFYLPQFHPIPENDEWWGKGFTEWANVGRSEAMFTGHVQPRLPADFGFYDLRLPEVMQQQAALARQFGLKGFCFHYYWFDGKRLLERPLENLLNHPEIDIPFCLCWANENWTRRWDGQESEVLIAQNHSADDDIAMIGDVARYMNDPRYYKVDGKPLFFVYRPDILPEPRDTIERWRAHCRDIGIGEIMVAGALTFGLKNPAALGFDIAVEFPPHAYPGESLRQCYDETDAASRDFVGAILDYQSYVDTALKVNFAAECDVIRTAIPGWDNTPRRGLRGTVFLKAEPDRYQTVLTELIERAEPVGDARPLVMINAWNEWAEGAYLEPDRPFGHAFLNATARALTGVRHGRLLLPEADWAFVEMSDVEVGRYRMDGEATPLERLVDLGTDVLDYDLILLPGGGQTVSSARLAKAIALMHENALIGAVGFGETGSEATGTQALLADWGLLIKMQVPETLADGPAFGDAVLVRTSALRPMLKAAGALKSDWLPDPNRAAFLSGCLTTLCEIQGFAVMPDVGED